MEEKSIEIELDGLKDGDQVKRDGWEVCLANGNGYLWAVYGTGPAGQEIVLTIKGIPGSFPVACCATEWESKSIRPIITDAIIELRSVQRSKGKVRIAAFNRSNEDRYVMMGVVFPVIAGNPRMGSV